MGTQIKTTETNDLCFDELRSKTGLNDFKYANVNLADLFAEKHGTYLNELNLYLLYFNKIPNFIHEVNINCEKANLWFVTAYKEEIKDRYYDKRFFNKSKEAKFDDLFYMMGKDLMVNFDTNQSIVRFLFRETDTKVVEAIITGIKKYKNKKERNKPEISVLVSSKLGIGMQSLNITKPRLNIEDNYNDDFKAVHEIIIKRLSKKNDKGIVLLHGKPGTGKTSYIRYLVTRLKKSVIFLPPNMAGAITDPELISVLINNPNSVFIIEDAEKIIVDRNLNGHSPVSALLNISDGLLSDCLNIQIVCSFNTDISKVDSALMRKGRLIAKYEFKELETVKAQQLSDKLSLQTNIYKPMTLSEIYNYEDMNFQTPNLKKAIGFQTIMNPANHTNEI